MTMDKVRFSCPRCQTIMQTGAEKIGYDVACPHCSHRFRLVESSETVSGDGQSSSSNRDAATLPPSKFPAAPDNRVGNRPPFTDATPPQATKSPPPFSGHGGQAPVIGRVPMGHSPTQPAGFTCPYCGTHAPPNWKSEVSTIGWIVFAILLVTTCVFCFIGLFIRDRYRVCSKCRIRLG